MIQTTTNNQAFVDAFAYHFADGDTDFDSVSSLFINRLKTSKDPNELAIGKKILQTAIKGQKEYYKSSLCGRIEKVFQKLLKLFRIHTAYYRAKDWIKYPGIQEVKTSNQPMNDSETTLKVMMAHYFAIKECQTLYFPLGDLSNPSTILIAKPNGDVYEIPRDRASCKGQGSPNPGSRRFYAGTLHKPDGTQKEIGIITNLTPNPLDQYDSDGILARASTESLSSKLDQKDRIEHLKEAQKKLIKQNQLILNKVKLKMQNEFSFLESVQDIDGVIKVYDNFSINISGTNACFTIVDYHPSGDLTKFLKKNKMTKDQTIEFMSDLLTSYSKLHSKNIIHRDVKPENILVTKDLKSILIDFETATTTKNTARKKENTSTVKFMPPEYVSALLNGVYNYIVNGNHKPPDSAPPFPVPATAITRTALKTAAINKILEARHPDVDLSKFLPDATTQAMDVWSLGLVFFELAYGVDLIGEACGFDYMAYPSELRKTENMHNVLRETLPNFIAAMQSKTEPTKDEWKDLWKKIKDDPKIWEQIILPMLNPDPKIRATMEGALQALHKLKPQMTPNDGPLAEVWML